MNDPAPFDLARAELRKGVMLIEASAGTGKTYAISGLVLRFVLEQGIPIHEILAVTYTVAATAELRDRVRARLRGALDDLRRGESVDEITSGFLKSASRAEIATAVRNLDSAVQNFDEARIFTIHGFCQRVLGEGAFESGALFDTEMLADASALLEEVARDFWRRHFYTTPPLLPRLAVTLKKSPDEWVKLLRKTRNHPGIRILPPQGGRDTAAITRLLEGKLAEITAEWVKSGKAAAEILATHKGLSRREDAFRDDKVEEILRSLAQLAESTRDFPPGALGAVFAVASVHDPEKLIGEKRPPEHRLFELCAEFAALSGEFFDQLTHEFVTYADGELRARKERLGVVTYDDLLVRVRDALRGPGGAGFAAATGAKYRVALIDEFQDTDPVQYEIFHGIFGGGAHHLWFIGDPKQAIYSFRGADVFTYREAARGASREFTLGTNWRSEKRLLNGVNLLFAKHQPLGEGIFYREVHPPASPRDGFEEIAGSGARLRFRYLQDENEGGEIKASDAETLIRGAVDADIARLKAAGTKLGGRELRYGDMAVLVRYNYEAVSLQELFRARGIKSVLKTEKSVLHTPEARELRLLLEGVLEPAHATRLNTALTTSLVEPRPGDIGAVERPEAAREVRLGQFIVWHETWKTSGFMAMFRRLLAEGKVRERLVRLPGGERMLANFLHLSELLHAAETGERLTPAGLALWLARQERLPESAATADEHQIRLESDDDAVLIATIHKSKGLEYPVVFCPYLWKPGDRSKKKPDILFHDAEAGGKITFDLRDAGDVPDHAATATRERFEESLRIMYVALTRAKNLCFVYAGDIKDSDNSPLACILEAPPWRSRIGMLAEKSDGCIDLTAIDHAADAAQQVPAAAPESTALREKILHRAIPQGRMVASFSSLVSGAEDEDSAEGFEDGGIDAGEVSADFSALAHFERSTRTGLFWHDLLENLEFRNDAAIEPLVLEKLVSHGFGNIFSPMIAAQVRNLMSVPLGEGVRLRDVSAKEKRAEVEFSHPIAPVAPDDLQRVFARHGATAEFSRELGRLDFRPTEGFMRGFIDLIFRHDGRFYIADWKSNWLGNRPADYDAPRLRDSMLRHFYQLQYHLYTVAADLFLARALPGYSYDAHFGGVFYIFIRGVDGATPGRGVFFDRPAPALIRDLREMLTGGGR